MTGAQRVDAWRVLMEAYADEPPDELLAQIDAAFAAYKADAAAFHATPGTAPEGRTAAVLKRLTRKPASVGEERADAAAITKDCRALLEALPRTVDDLDNYRRELAARLRQRLENFPPMVDALLVTDGVDVWASLERLRVILTRPRSWPQHGDTLAADLRAVAGACDRAPRLDIPNQTKPPAIARARFVQALRDALGPIEGRDSVARDLLAALGVKAPERF